MKLLLDELIKHNDYDSNVKHVSIYKIRISRFVRNASNKFKYSEIWFSSIY
jgi:hypothetical protein